MQIDNFKAYDKYSRSYAKQYLAVIDGATKAAGVTCEDVYVFANYVYEAIMRTAEEKGCDLILMATHGRKGVQALLIGSETTKVVTHTKLPVLVLR